MRELEELDLHCPYCGEPQAVLADPSDVGIEYTEDCQVCCRPMILLHDGHCGLSVRREEDVRFE